MPDLLNLTPDALLELLVIIVVAWLLLALFERVLPWLAERFAGRRRLYILAVLPVVRLVIILLAGGLGLTRVVEPTFENMIALLGALGLALGFALRDWVSSIIAGIVTLFEMPYHVGDWIRVEDAYGEVQSIGMRAATLVTPDDNVVVVPHLKLWDSLIHNANDARPNLQCAIDFYVEPRHNGLAVRAALEDVALTSPYLQVRQPVLVIAREKPWGTHYIVRAYPVEPRDQFRFITDVTLRGKAALEGLGVAPANAPVAVDAAR